MKIEHMALALALSLATGLPAAGQAADPQSPTNPKLERLTLDGPLTQAQRDDLQRAGVELLEACGPHTFLVRAPAEGLTRVAGARLEALPRAAKLAPELERLLDGGALPGGPLTLRAVTIRDRSVTGPAAAVRDLVPPRGTFEAVQDASGRGHLWLRVQPEHLVEAIDRLATHPDVIRVERQLPLEFKNDNSSWLIQSGDEGQGRTVWRKGLTGFGQVVGVADSGLDADGCQFRFGPERSDVTLATDAYDPPAAEVLSPGNKVLAYYVIGNADAYDDASGGYHGTHTVGDMAGDNYEHLATATAAGHDPQDGMAPGAQIVFQDIGAENGSLSGLMGVSMFDLLLQAYDTGVRVHNNSYGSAIISVGYDADSASIDQAAWELGDLLVVFAAGNSGADQEGNLQDKSLGGTGSTAKNTLVVGASGPVELSFYGQTFQLAEDLLFFSSQGPTWDSRLKPDLVAPGMVFSATSDNATAIDLGCCDIHDRNKIVSNNDDDNCTVDQDSPTFGTSFSSPIAAGAAALVRQYFTDGFWLTGEADDEAGFTPSSALLKATLIAGAKPLTGVIVGMGTSDVLTQPPSYTQGWGRVHLEQALWFAGDARRTLVLDDVPNPVPGGALFDAQPPPYPEAAAPLVTDDERTWQLPVPRPGSIMKVVLVWTDPAAAAGTELTLVNDLDLEVEGPTGTYVGNKEYDGFGFSKPSWQMPRDHLNNLEVVTIDDPDPGWWQVKTIGRSVDGNGQAGSDAQGYALVVTGEFVAPSPLAIEPAVVAPGEVIQDVHLTGEAFVPGMQIDLGPGLSAEGLEVIDQTTATIATLTVDAGAAEGPRDVRLSTNHSLIGVGLELLQVDAGGSGGGCGCAQPGRAAGPVVLGLLLLLGLGLARRTRA